VAAKAWQKVYYSHPIMRRPPSAPPRLPSGRRFLWGFGVLLLTRFFDPGGRPRPRGDPFSTNHSLTAVGFSRRVRPTRINGRPRFIWPLSHLGESPRPAAVSAAVGHSEKTTVRIVAIASGRGANGSPAPDVRFELQACN
jgi:hypothetical protein